MATQTAEPTALTPAPVAGQVARNEFGADQISVQAETASSAVAAQAQAVVQARYVMAMRNQRDIDDVRVRLLAECKRPGFAEVARYAKPMGGSTVTGFSIRFAEAAARCMRNILCEVVTVWDDPYKRIVRVSVTDLESNLTYPVDVLIEKTVERKRMKSGQTAIGTRMNNYGEPVYILPATDDETNVKQNNLVSKALRNSILRLIPGDVLDDAEAQINATLNNKAAQDPAAERKKISDAFAVMGVMPSDLKTFLGHDLAQATPAEMVKLRGVYQALKGGESTWQDVVEDKAPKPEEKKPGLADLTEKVKASTAGAEPTPPPPVVDPTVEAEAQKFIDATEPPVDDGRCKHEKFGPKGVPAGKTYVCPDCQDDVKGPWPKA